MSDSSAPPRRTCGTMNVHRRLLATDPSYAVARAHSENRAWLAARTTRAPRVGEVTIPVVVHIVHNNGEQNISDEQVHSQIAVLNADFTNTNPDGVNIPPHFAHLAASARVRFALATTSPDGSGTTGITRTLTQVLSWGDDDAVKSAAQGGEDAWDSARYLNLWVCALGGGLLGYAQFPGGPAATDGVVILHSAFGTNGTAAPPFHLGRTASHEIGHWLNLHHIWGDDGTGCGGTDLVDDTPNQGGPNFGQPVFPHASCNNGPDGDLFMDYMDYVDDAAMFVFTNDQVTRMQTCLDGDRPGIGSVAGAGWSELYSDNDHLARLKVIPNADGRLEVIGINEQGRIWHTWQTAPNGGWAGSWSELYSDNDHLASLEVKPNADGRLEVIGINEQGRIWRTSLR
jgi:hypothetical protein